MVQGAQRLVLAMVLVAGCGNAAGGVAPLKAERTIELADSDGKPTASTTLPSAAKRSRLPRPGVLHGR